MRQLMAATALIGLTVTGGGMIVLMTTAAAVSAAGLLTLAYNRLVRRQNLVKEGYSGIDVQLKRRHELVPSLIACVQGYASFERSVLEDVTRLRTAADAATTMADVNQEENRLTAGLKSFFALAEAYPDLKANANFAQLSTQLVEIEDALQYSRRYYNGAVRDLNIAVESFPSNLIAGWFGFESADYFEVESVGERAAPQITLKRQP